MRSQLPQPDPPGLEAGDLPPLLDACATLSLVWRLCVPPGEAWRDLSYALARDGAAYLAVKVRDGCGHACEVLVWSDVNSGPHSWRRRGPEDVRRELSTWLLCRRPSEWHASDEVIELAEAARKAGM